ncbi:hypothetical protein SAMN06265377_3383 [Flagellimonas pacifica]|uniref:Uncharacterized protein n=1 Tax=Flagellimonas pacifica TaxID=1247520 RepID=A0A285N1B4_9FLAO|nr:hypothetical protein SAMN06265377_3383 [Allomuricauda parva]
MKMGNFELLGTKVVNYKLTFWFRKVNSGHANTKVYI